MARYQGRHRTTNSSPFRRRSIVIPSTAVVAGAVTWGALSTANGATNVAGAAAAEIKPITTSDRSATQPAAASNAETAAVVAKVQSAMKARAASHAAAVSRASANRVLVQQRVTALRSLSATAKATPYAAAAEPMAAPAESTDATASPSPAEQQQPASGGFACPIRGCQGHFTSGFGPRVSPGGIGSTYHEGIDFAIAVGTPLQSVHSGTVTAVGWYGGQGKRVNVDIGGGVTVVYAHMSGWSVSVGQHVEAGQTVGFSGNTGNSTGPHLHFEIRINGTAVNPVPWLRSHGIMF